MASELDQQGVDHRHIQAAFRILRQVPLIDGHNDWPWNIRSWYGNALGGEGIDLSTAPFGQTDIGRLRRGQLGAQFWSAFVPCPKPSDRQETTLAGSSSSLEPLKKTLQQIDLIHLMVQAHPAHFAIAKDAAEIHAIFRSGRIACMIGVEGLHQIGNTLSCLRLFHTLGVRYITLTHNCNNIYADAATAQPSGSGGLSEEGRRVVREMNRIGLMVDLSHTSEAAQEKVLQLSRAPVIFSHSSCYTLCPHVRNVSDKILDALQLNGGIIMICFLRELVRPVAAAADSSSKEPSVHDVVDHIIYAGERIGYDHVGIGSDFDGMLNGPAGLDEVSDYPRLVATLIQRGVSEDDIKKVIGLNMLRVMDEVDSVSRAIMLEGKQLPEMDDIVSTWTGAERAMMEAEGVKRAARS